MKQKRSNSYIWLTGAAAVLAVISLIGYVAYTESNKVTCSDQTIPHSSAVSPFTDNNFPEGQTYTIEGHDGITHICTKQNGTTVSSTTTVDKVDTKIVKGSKQPTPAPVSSQRSPSSCQYFPTPYGTVVSKCN